MSFDPFAGAPHPMVGGGSVWPPAGFVNLWRRQPELFKEPRWHARGGVIDLDEWRWSWMNRVNRQVNKEMTPVADRVQFGVEDYWHVPARYADRVVRGKEHDWTLPREYGDCEDYALRKRVRLTDYGEPPHLAWNCVRLAICLTYRAVAHAVLTVDTETPTKQTFVLDNTNNFILPWHYCRYRWLAREVPGQFMWERISAV